jgi:hypothetical protein
MNPNSSKPYQLELTFENEPYLVLIHVTAPTETYANGEVEYHYDLELQCQSENPAALSSTRLKALKDYLQNEGHLDAACETYHTTQTNP